MADTTPLVLAVNGGSSSIKYALFTLDAEPGLVRQGSVGSVGAAATVDRILNEIETHLITGALNGCRRRPSPACVRWSRRRRIHVRGYKEQGTITTPFAMAVLDDLDRFHLASDALARLPHLGLRGDAVRIQLHQQLTAHRAYVRARGEDLPAIREWRWPGGRRAAS